MKILDCRLLQILLGALRVKGNDCNFISQIACLYGLEPVNIILYDTCICVCYFYH